MYYIIETQTTNGQGTNIIKTAETLNAAYSIYHSVLAAAAESKVEYHACVILNERGQHEARGCFEHPIEVTAEEVSNDA